MNNVVDLPVITTLPLNPDRLLNNAIGKLQRVVIIGIDHGGNEVFASSEAGGGTVLWDLERTKHKLMRIVDDLSE
jgi:hypothetical protein